MPIRVISKRGAAPVQESVSFGLPAPAPGTVQKPAGLSLCMIVKNEERFLEQCLRSVAGVVDEICIVDTGSTDRTIEIARAFGARVEQREWRNDFAWARNAAIEMATYRWILMLDADEELKTESIPALRALKNVPAATAGIWIRCFNLSDDYKGTGEMSHALVRIFPNNERVRFRGMIHEFVTLDGKSDGLPAVNAPISIVHHGYLKEVVEGRDKAKRNFEIVQAAAKADPTDPFAWFNVGTTAFMMQDYPTARDALEKMRELNGDQPRGFVANGHAVLAETYCDKLGDAVSGEKISREALHFSPHYANAHFQLGKALVAQHRFDEARQAFMDAIDDGRYSHLQFVVDDQVSIWKAHSEIGSSYVMQGDEVKAIEWFRKGLANAPKVEPLMLNLARALERVGEMDEARATFKDVYETFADDYGTVDYVNFLLRRQEVSTARAVIDASYERLSVTVAAQLLLAAAQIAGRYGEMDAMVRYLEAAAERVPGNADVLNLLEGFYRENGHDDKLRALLEREAATAPATAADFVRRSYQANVAGDHARGLETAEHGLLNDPEHEHLRYNAAVAASTLGELERALSHLAFVRPQDGPLFVPAHLLRARIHRTLANADDAVASVEAVLTVEPANTEALALGATLAEERGDLPRAEKALKALVASDAQRGAVEYASFLLRQGRFDEAARVADAALQR